MNSETIVDNGRSIPSVVPLADPLRSIRKFVGWILRLGLIASLFLGGIYLFSKQIGFLAVAALIVCFFLPILLFIWLILPNRPVNAFFLRSFRNDDQAWPMRRACLAALGSEFRLSGIRDPQRRHSILDYLSIVIFVFRYATPKYMNLEAGGDWRTRLWSSLRGARCAIIDLSETTPALEFEIRLCLTCMKAERLLFIGDATRETGEWKTYISSLADGESVDVDSIRLVVWNPHEPAMHETMYDEVDAFAEDLPEGVAGYDPESFRKAYALTESGDSLDETLVTHGWQFVVSVFVLGVVLSGLLPFVGRIVGIPGLRRVVDLATTLIIAWNGLAYFVNCGSNRRRVAFLTLLPLPIGAVLFLVPAVQMSREAGNRSQEIVALRQQGLAMNNYGDVHGGFPPSGLRPGGERWDDSLHGWQTALLPYVDQASMFNDIDFQRPWNDETNRSVFQYVLPVYMRQSMPERTDQAGYALTHYSGNVRSMGLPLSGFTDGISYTILAGEAEGNFVPWGHPKNLRDPADGLQNGPDTFGTGRNSSGGAFMLMADGSVQFMSKDIHPKVLKALSTPDGGESEAEEFIESDGRTESRP